MKKIIYEVFQADPKVTEAKLSNGLVKGWFLFDLYMREIEEIALGHAYSITRVADVTTESGPITLIRCLSKLIFV